MSFYDIHTHVFLPEVLEKLKIDGIGVVNAKASDKIFPVKEFYSEVPKKKYDDITILSTHDREIAKKAINRIDILGFPEPKGFLIMDRELASKLASKEVVFELRAGNLIRSTGYERSVVMSYYRRAIALLKKYDAYMVITSGALSTFELRSYYDLVNIGVFLGLEKKEAKDCVKFAKEIIEVKFG